MPKDDAIETNPANIKLDNRQSDGTPQPLTVSEIAWVCHEANRTYCLTQNDASQLPWDQAPNWQRMSAIQGVQFRQSHPDAPLSAQHESWYKQKDAEGWVYGEVKDADRKTHPCFLPYDQLPAWQRRKDALFASIVIALSETDAH